MKNKGHNKRYIVLASVMGLICICFVVQLVNWQIVHGEEYRELSNSNNSYTQVIPAARGEIVDSNGIGLEVNNNSYNVIFNKIYVDKDTQNDLILQLIDIFDTKGEKWIDELPIVIKDGQYQFQEGKEAEVAQLKSDYRLNSYATAEDCINRMASKQWYNCDNYSITDKRNIISVCYNMNKNGYDYGTPYVFADNVSDSMVAVISENSPQLKGIQISTDTNRSYINGTIAPHIVGTIGAISQEEYNKKKDSGLYQLDSKIGKTGIESALEDTLVGIPGEKQISTTADGSVADSTVTQAAKSGNTVYLTIDARLQEVAANALEEACTAAQKTAKKGEVVTGSVVMLDVDDFSVLCAQSYPSYDLSQAYQDKNYYSELATDEINKPLIARAFEGTYPIGSTMKPAVALAALEEGSIDNSTVYNCTHTYTRFAPSFTPTCLGTHGRISLQRAMAVSCNIYFYETGYNLGINDMNEYQTRLGLGQKTGVEIAEANGVLAGPKEREANGQTWYQGDTIMAAIGQSDNLITPIQLATYCATIANDGVRLKTHLVDKIMDYSRQTIVSENTKENTPIVSELGVSQENIDLVKEAMRGVVTRSDGTARYTLGNYSIPVAAKTGTAETFQSDGVTSATDHVTLMVFAPYEDPEIAIGIVLEYGASGTYTANIAKALMDEYFTEISPYEG